MKQLVVRLACGASAISILGAGIASAGGPAHCSGTAQHPGVLTGTYPNGAVINGVCQVNAGLAEVRRSLTLAPNSVLLANFGRNHKTGTGGSSLHVDGQLVVGKGAVLFLGCSPKESPCVDDSQKHPKLTSAGNIHGNLTATSALAVIVHSTTIGGDVTQRGGGGGYSCNPVGPFKAQHSPAFSAYEDSTVRGDLTISGLRSCWLGVARVRVGNDLTFLNNQFADGDAIEILSNHVRNDLTCRGNSRVWDSAETGRGEYPRTPEPNTVGNRRIGQCVLASPSTKGGPPGPGPF